MLLTLSVVVAALNFIAEAIAAGTKKVPTNRDGSGQTVVELGNRGSSSNATHGVGKRTSAMRDCAMI
jgi:hypothetical protein